jgi:hypothetical protein
MATIDESVFKGIFGAFQQDHLTTDATFWNLSEDGRAPKYPTVYVPGDNTIVIDGQAHTFKNGAFVYEGQGRLQAVDGNYADSGAITVNGTRVQPTSIDSYTRRAQGNIATLKYTTGDGAEPGQLTLTMPEGKGYGFAFRYPASTAQELADAAEKQNAIVQVKDKDGEILDGFFTKGKGGILPAKYDGYTTATSLDPGEFVAIKHYPDGSVYLRPYQNYTEAQIDQYTQYGKYGPPSNNQANLTTVDGKPLNAADYPAVNVARSDAGVQAPADGVTKQGAETSPKTVDGQQPPTTKAPEPQPQASGTTTDGVPKSDAPAPSEGISTLGKVAKYLAPLALTIGAVVEGSSSAYEAYKKNGSALDVGTAAVEGVGEGIADTFLPGARSGYNNVVGDGKLNWADRLLNAADDATGTATAIGSAAVVAETAGVVTIPATIPTGAATIIAGISNLGVNVAKGALKVTGLAGQDQDGGYIYDGARAAANGVEHLFGYSAAETHADGLLKQSTANATAGDGSTNHKSVERATSG